MNLDFTHQIFTPLTVSCERGARCTAIRWPGALRVFFFFFFVWRFQPVYSFFVASFGFAFLPRGSGSGDGESRYNWKAFIGWVTKKHPATPPPPPSLLCVCVCVRAFCHVCFSPSFFFSCSLVVLVFVHLVAKYGWWSCNCFSWAVCTARMFPFSLLHLACVKQCDPRGDIFRGR